MRLLALLLLPALATAQIATMLDTDSVGTSRLVINSNFGYLDSKILRGSGTPQSNSLACTSSVNLGVIYLNTNAGARASTLYICERTGALTYEWAGPYATSASGGVIWRGPWESTRTYAVQEMVESGGSSYVAIAAHTNSPPPSAFWQLAAAAGSGGGGGGSYTFQSPLVNTSGTVSINQALLSIGWPQLTGLPSTFAPSAHTHGNADITDLAYSKLTGVPSTFAPSSHNHASSEINSGTLADARIAASNVTQHQAVLSIGWSQLTGLPSIVGLASTNNAIPIGNGTAFANSIIPDCRNATTGKLLYNDSTRTFSCGSDQTGAGGSGITALNGRNETTQDFTVGTAGTNFNIVSTTGLHTFNLPDASGVNRGLMTAALFTTLSAKQDAISGAPGTWPSTFAPSAHSHPFTDLTGTAADAQVPDNLTIGLSATMPGGQSGGDWWDAIQSVVIDPVAATPGLRTLGTGAQQAAAGNDSRLSDTRTPTDNTVSTSKIVDGAVTLAKQADVATTVIMGRIAAGSGPQQALTPSQVKTILSMQWNDIGGLAPSATVDTTVADNIINGTLPAARLPNSGVVSGTCTNCDLTIDEKGRVTAKASGASGGGAASPDLLYFGDGSDGDVTCTGSSTLTRDMYYLNLTLGSGCAITTAGYRIFVAETLTVSSATPANAIRWNGNNGASAGSSSGAGGGAFLPAAVLGGTTGNNYAGAAGSTAAGSQAAAPNGSCNNGGGSGAGGAGGAGSSGAGGALRAGLNPTGTLPTRRFSPDLIRGVTLIVPGCPGAGGGGGGGDGTNPGGGGGGGATGGGTLWISAKVLARTSDTPAGVISASGGAGGNGRTQTAGNVGGGGAGGGGGGGWVYFAYGSATGTSNATILDASGGVGGTGGGGVGIGTAGNGGNQGNGGRITICDLTANTCTDTVGSTGGTASGTTGGSGVTTRAGV